MQTLSRTKDEDLETALEALGVPSADEADRAAQAFAVAADRAGLVDVAYGRLDTPMGELTLAATEQGVVEVALPNRDPDEVLATLATRISGRVVRLAKRIDPARRELDEYFAGTRREFDLELDWRLAKGGFYGQVLRRISEVPYGSTLSYGELAGRAGNRRAHRAAGTACGSNPIPILVPCHRILQSGGGTGNYGGGPEMKRRLLRLEGVLD
ncbi:MAG: methylated-DNA--[protein]-cysteine S-methyltransferase [Solirubrobacterales bacterium]|nr:methylated-DNA--[protein]-cysteine S-methyltransferase [Solirubrobacterales bacterium]